jgi:hypothetical protein
VHRSERRVDVLDRLDQDPDAGEIVDLVELLAADHHLLVDRIEVLRSPVDVRLDAGLAEARACGLEHAVDVRLSLAPAALDEAGDLAVRARMHRLEGEVLELPLDLLDPEAVRERRVDLERLGRDPLLLVGRERRERPHVVQAIRELDQQDADVARHRHDHLANVLRLLLLAAAERQRLELREPVDDPRDGRRELALEVLERDVRVLDGVVEQRRLQRGRVEAEVGDEPCDGEGVLDERLAGLASLPFVMELGERVRALDLLEIGLRVVAADDLEEPVEPVARRAIARTQPREQATTTLGPDLLLAVHRSQCRPGPADARG